MAWARIDDRALNHPKIANLADKPFRLWVWGLCYVNQYLTDGFIAAGAPIPSRLKRADAELVKAGLWEVVNDGWQVHDYLQWNDSRDEVLTKRAAAKDRARQSRENKARTNGERAPHVLSGLVSSGSFPERERERKPALVTERAGDFCRRYAELYPIHRNGARYVLTPNRDFLAAVDLCETWTDDAHLERMAICFLTTNHEFAAKGSRTIPQFKALASWVDGELRQWEKDHPNAS